MLTAEAVKTRAVAMAAAVALMVVVAADVALMVVAAAAQQL